MNVLVVGGAGYIGSHAVRALLAAGHHVWVYDNLSRGHRGAVPAGKLIEGEVADRKRLAAAMIEHKIDAVMHFAAFALVNESVNDPSIYYQNNVVAALELLEAMREAKVPRIVFSSTTATYGEPDVIPIPETTLQQPINPYGFTKLVIEQALADYAKAYGIGYAALRYFNAAGAHPSGEIGEDHDPETHIIRSCCKWLWASARRSRSMAKIIRRLMGPAFATTFMSVTWPMLTYVLLIGSNWAKACV